MNLTYLRYFTEVASFLNISKAADALYISQPALSRSIKLFEDSLGVKLFTRNNKGLALTEAGKILLKESSSFFDSEKCLMEKLHSVTTDSNPPIRMLYTNDVMHYKLSGFSLQYNKNICTQKFVIERHTWTSIRMAFARNDADLAMGISLVFLGLNGIKTKTLFHADNYILVEPSHPIARQKSVKLKELTEYTYIGTTSAGKRDIDDFSSRCNLAGVDFKNFSERNTLDSALVDVALGQGFTVVSEGLIPDMYKESLVAIPCSELGGIDFSLAWKGSNESPNLLKVIDAMCNFKWN